MNEGRQTTRHDNGNSGFLETSLMTGNKNSKMIILLGTGIRYVAHFFSHCELWPLSR